MPDPAGMGPLARDRAAAVGAFEFDTWPLCEQHERAGVVTLADRQLIEAWGRRAQLQLQLEIDRRFDHLGEWLEISAWPGVE